MGQDLVPSEPERSHAVDLELLALSRMAERLRARLSPEAGGACGASASPELCGEAANCGMTGIGATSSASSVQGVCSSPNDVCCCSCCAGSGRKRAASWGRVTGDAGPGWGGSCAGTAACDGGAAKRQRQQEQEMPPPAPRPAAQRQPCGGSASMRPPPPRPRAAACDGAPAAASPGPAAPPAPPAQRASPPSGLWQGPLVHRRGGRTAHLCTLAVQLPASYLDRLPPALHAAQLAHRRSVPLGRHVVCRCALLPGAAERQLSAIAAMARAQLVAVVPLRLSQLVVVPYLDSRGCARMVAFLRVFGGA
ncbi:hypothetical protein MNEG_7558 [Monoraphidium neglectum]|uniref:Uncharacterized protein n=1 Tax=Monoraphidium neglectum TaxID=145388 RepID=A0A0D2KYW9_9CHLO|nr:hypothetical protein MNEG_7558 [Monoraphidium neglectum]KIZ00404.1 hypothetical protein MNEG_7558 [Monoraphidium neglectum]|eukprot:XP_013899423.1 hypothetical protein MNEG_7558 [Monoraphidium neglectum]